MSAEQPMRSDADLAPIGALTGGRALPVSRLAAEARVAPSTVSEHLAPA
jgi:hypothetical protein